MKPYRNKLGYFVASASAVVICGCAGLFSPPLNLTSHDASTGLTRAQTSDSVIGQRSGPSPDQHTVNRAPVVRSQSAPPQPAPPWLNETTPGSDDQMRYPMAASGDTSANASRIGTTYEGGFAQPTQFTNPQALQQGVNAWSNGAANAPPADSGSGTRSSSTRPLSTTSASPRGSDDNWQSTVPRVSQAPSSLPPPNVSTAPPADSLIPPPPANDTTAIPQPPIGPWPQAYGLPQGPSPPGGIPSPASRFADIYVNVQEAQTGRLMLGAAVNSDAGLTGQIVVDERNFDWRRFPTSIDDLLSGNAFRGDGQGFRIEALPGREVQRYMVQFTDPYLNRTRFSLNLSGFLFDRRFFDWDEQRLGGRIGLGRRITPDLSLSFSVRAEEVKIDDPRVQGVPELDRVLGDNELYSGRVTLTNDTRDLPFAPTQGHYLELAYEQVFGSFDYPRGSVDYRRYFLLTERADGSGRHVLGFSNRFAVSGSETPVFENFFAGGHSTLRGFDFRGASPLNGGVTVGGRLSLLSSIEYLFPITADDMLKGVVFCDYGTIEEDIKIEGDDYRVALGAGLRISVPAMGPAPIALDFAVPVAREGTDDIQNFSFHVGLSR